MRTMATTGEGSSFVGREAELAVLAGCARRAQSRRAGVVLVEGVAGVGKTALVQRWLATEDSRGMTVLRAFCDADESDWAFGVVGQLVRWVPRKELEREALLGGGGPLAGTSPLQVGEQLLRLVDDLQEAAPVAVIVEDVHWADLASLQALGFLLRRLEADRVLTVLTTRPPARDDIRKLAADRNGGRAVLLTGLRAEPVAELVQAATGRQVDELSAHRLQEHTDGNPLYLQALLAEVPSDQLLPGNRNLSLPVPGTLAAAVRRQLNSLPADARALTEAAAVLGTRVPLNLVGQIAGVSDPATSLQPALAANLLHWWPHEPICLVMVAHALQREAIIEALAPARRRDLHAAAAERVDRAASWRHRVAAGDGLDAQLARQLEQAANECLADSATERAATLLLWASDVATTRTERERLLLTAAARLLWIMRVRSVQALLPRIHNCTSSPLRSLVTGSYALINGSLDRAETDLTDALKCSETDPSQRWAHALARSQLVAVRYWHGSSGAEIIALARPVLALGGLDRSSANKAKCYLFLGELFQYGPQAALEELIRLTRLPKAPEVTAHDVWLLIFRGMAHMLCGMPAAAREDLLQARRLNDSGASQGMEEYVYTFLALTYYWSGSWGDAAINADLALTALTAEQRHSSDTDVCAYVSWVYSGRGETRRTQNLLQTADRYALPFNAHLVYMSRAVDAQTRADHPAMLSAIQHMLTAPPGPLTGDQVLWKPLQVEALLNTEHHDEAATALTELQTLTRTYPSLGLAAAWLSGRMAEVRGDTVAAQTAYEAGLALPSTPDKHVLHQAFLEHAYGRFLATQELSKRARTWLMRARDRYASMAAAPFQDRCEADLAAIGGIVTPRSHAEDLTSLTDRERDIAHLAGQGLTNKEIAKHLIISSKTVEHHLGHVYTKLNLSGRRQLRGGIRQPESKILG
ncbi:AAA family ATPase [Streptomyces sp. NBC_01614]|uniref:helix-turn-helix transcriptional regulator n=2 Tax=Streptomyces sp. NBC_01614 TaxID=2975897 RepID=UPI0038701CB3